MVRCSLHAASCGHWLPSLLFLLGGSSNVLLILSSEDCRSDDCLQTDYSWGLQ